MFLRRQSVRDHFYALPDETLRNKFSEHNLFLQSTVAIFVSYYALAMFRNSNGYTWRRNKRGLLNASSLINVGVEGKKGIDWDVSYIALKPDNELKLHFFIQVDLHTDYEHRLPDTFSKVFKCSVWVIAEHLWFRLSDRNGNTIRSFNFEKKFTPGVFEPVVQEISMQMQRRKMSTDITVNN
jgi:hypothetical protein